MLLSNSLYFRVCSSFNLLQKLVGNKIAAATSQPLNKLLKKHVVVCLVSALRLSFPAKNRQILSVSISSRESKQVKK